MAQSRSVIARAGRTQPPSTATHRTVSPGTSIAARFVIAAAASAAVDLLWWLRQPRQLIRPDRHRRPSHLGQLRLTCRRSSRTAWLRTRSRPGFCSGTACSPGGVRYERPAGTRRPRTTASMLDFPAVEPAAASVAGRSAVARGPACPASGHGRRRRGQRRHGQRGPERSLPSGLLCGLALPRWSSLCSRPCSRLCSPGAARAPAGPRGSGWRSAIPSPSTASPGRWPRPVASGTSRATASCSCAPRNAVHQWPRRPGWLAALAMLVIADLGRGADCASGRPPVWVEKPAARRRRRLGGRVFLITSRMPGQLGKFHGFDDAQSLVGANLLGEGLLPLARHDVHPRACGRTRCRARSDSASSATHAGAASRVPRCGSSRSAGSSSTCSPSGSHARNRWFLIGMALLLLPGMRVFTRRAVHLRPADLSCCSVRRCAAAASAGARRSWPRLFGQAVLVPETLFLAGPALLAVAAADLTHPDPGQPDRAGVAQIVLVCRGRCRPARRLVRLSRREPRAGRLDRLLQDLRAWARRRGRRIPRSDISPWGWAAFATCIALVLATFWSVVARVRGGRPWSTS